MQYLRAVFVLSTLSPSFSKLRLLGAIRKFRGTQMWDELRVQSVGSLRVQGFYGLGV